MPIDSSGAFLGRPDRCDLLVAAEGSVFHAAIRTAANFFSDQSGLEPFVFALMLRVERVIEQVVSLARIVGKVVKFLDSFQIPIREFVTRAAQGDPPVGIVIALDIDLRAVARGLSRRLQQRFASVIDPGRQSGSGGFEDGWEKVEQVSTILPTAARGEFCRIAEHKRDAHRGFVRNPFLHRPALVAEHFSMVGKQTDQRVIELSNLFQGPHDLAHRMVHKRDLRVIQLTITAHRGRAEVPARTLTIP